MDNKNFDQPIIFFDGECNLCNSSVQFIIKLDSKSKFKFASLQSDFGKNIKKKFRVYNVDSFLLLKDKELFQKSTAALMVLKEFGIIGRLLFIFKYVPTCIRDSIYSYIAKNRYKWFGKSSSCMLPTTVLIDRFIK